MNINVETRELELIKEGDKALLKELYKKYRSPFVKWAQWKYTSTTDIHEIYQEAFTIFYFNVKEGKFTGENSSIKTYLFGIGKNLLNKKAAVKNNTESLDDVNESALPAETIFEPYEISYRQTLIKSILDKIGEPCRSILVKYYYDNFSMEAIAENLGYKTAMVVKKKKCECLIKIRKTLQEKNIALNMKKE